MPHGPKMCRIEHKQSWLTPSNFNIVELPKWEPALKHIARPRTGCSKLFRCARQIHPAFIRKRHRLHSLPANLRPSITPSIARTARIASTDTAASSSARNAAITSAARTTTDFTSDLKMTSLEAARHALHQFSDPVRSKTQRGFFKNSGEDTFLGAPTASVRKIAKEFGNLPLPDIRSLMQSAVHDERSLANMILCSQFQKSNEA